MTEVCKTNYHDQSCQRQQTNLEREKILFSNTSNGRDKSLYMCVSTHEVKQSHNCDLISRPKLYNIVIYNMFIDTIRNDLLNIKYRFDAGLSFFNTLGSNVDLQCVVRYE